MSYVSDTLSDLLRQTIIFQACKQIIHGKSYTRFINKYLLVMHNKSILPQNNFIFNKLVVS